MIKRISGEFYEHKKVTVELDGKQFTRVVRFRSDCGLYVVINNRMYFEYECETKNYVGTKFKKVEFDGVCEYEVLSYNDTDKIYSIGMVFDGEVIHAFNLDEKECIEFINS